MGFEPTTASLEGWDSTTELRPPLSFRQLLKWLPLVPSHTTLEVLLRLTP